MTTSAAANDASVEPEVRDEVVLLDADRAPIGTAPREGVHTTETRLHLAYSCWLLDEDGRFLLTRRALSKRSWPGVWTNSFCGHPRPQEWIVDAVRRGARTELGAEVTEIEPLIPDFAYRAVDSSGIVENEVCPVFVARLVSPLAPNPDEVAEHVWVEVDDLRRTLDVAPWSLSPWFVEQAALLSEADWASLATRTARHEGTAA